MKILTFAFMLSMSVLCGCATEQNKDNPIVSPDVIQSVEAESDEPQIPHYEPIWYREVR